MICRRWSQKSSCRFCLALAHQKSLIGYDQSEQTFAISDNVPSKTIFPSSVERTVGICPNSNSFIDSYDLS